MKAFALLASVLAAIPLLSGCTGLPKGAEPVSDFDIGRYLGQWHEIARLDHSFERGLSHVTATYSLRGDGRVDVINRGYDAGGEKWKQAEGVARFQGDPTVASLSVTFQWPFAGGYHVISLDREDYQWAMVAGPSHGYLWILARAPELDGEVVARLVGEATALGFPTDELIFVEHFPPPPVPRPGGAG